MYAFTSTGLWLPNGPVTIGAHGGIYGTAAQYGANNANGGVFNLTPTSSGYIESAVHLFTGSPNDGNSPNGGLLLDPNRQALYGTTYWGGNGIGTVFQLGV
ncbi:MAG: hypothetical protein JO060_02700 [Candidatus Eremiobacteraeota bacterium]|nr:hypothetical protein [Candidatus Eremiobacteraeota bacterium]